MGLTKAEKKQLRSLKRIVRGTPIKVTQIRGTSNIRLRGAGYNHVRQLGSTTGVSPTTQARAMVKVYKRKKSGK